MAPGTLALIMAEACVDHAGVAATTNGEAREDGTDDPVSSPVCPAPATPGHQLKRTPEEMAVLAAVSPDPAVRALQQRLWKIADALASSDADDFEAPRLRIGLRPADFT